MEIRTEKLIKESVAEYETDELKKAIVYNESTQDEGSCEFVSFGCDELLKRLPKNEYDDFIYELTGLTQEQMIEQSDEVFGIGL